MVSFKKKGFHFSILHNKVGGVVYFMKSLCSSRNVTVVLGMQSCHYGPPSLEALLCQKKESIVDRGCARKGWSSGLCVSLDTFIFLPYVKYEGEKNKHYLQDIRLAGVPSVTPPFLSKREGR